MLKISKNGDISLTRGDTAWLTVPLTYSGTDEPYEMNGTDKLTLSVKKTVNDVDFAFQKILVGSNTFHISPKDTAGLAFGKYKYDVQITTANGDNFTVIDTSTFEVLPEVG